MFEWSGDRYTRSYKQIDTVKFCVSFSNMKRDSAFI